MLNQIQCTAAEFNAAAYNDADSIVLFLCKECAAAIDKLELPEAAAKAAIAYTAQHDDIYDAGSVTTLVLPQGEGLLARIVSRTISVRLPALLPALCIRLRRKRLYWLRLSC